MLRKVPTGRSLPKVAPGASRLPWRAAVAGNERGIYRIYRVLAAGDCRHVAPEHAGDRARRVGCSAGRQCGTAGPRGDFRRPRASQRAGPSHGAGPRPARREQARATAVRVRRGGTVHGDGVRRRGVQRVETPRYTGAVYRASGSVRVGATQGRGCYGANNRYDKPRRTSGCGPSARTGSAPSTDRSKPDTGLTERLRRRGRRSELTASFLLRHISDTSFGHPCARMQSAPDGVYGGTDGRAVPCR